jgi:hypothetical protein
MQMARKWRGSVYSQKVPALLRGQEMRRPGRAEGEEARRPGKEQRAWQESNETDTQEA